MANVVAVVMNDDCNFALLQRHDGSWTFPSADQKRPNEDFKIAAARGFLTQGRSEFESIEEGQAKNGTQNFVYGLHTTGKQPEFQPDPFDFQAAAWVTPKEVKTRVQDPLHPRISKLLDNAQQALEIRDSAKKVVLRSFPLG
jgi:hypothetical protein